jgi:hypothetical protein
MAQCFIDFPRTTTCAERGREQLAVSGYAGKGLFCNRRRGSQRNARGQ